MLPNIPNNSNIFTESELKILRDRIQGSKKDPHGTFAGRVKPKIIELLEWLELKKNLEKLVKPRNKA
jgi:hypothetical protein